MLERRESIVGDGGDATVVSGALDTAAGCEAVVAEAGRVAGPVTILINNASVFHKETLLESTPESVDLELAINLLAPMNLTRAVARRLRNDNASGHVINLLDRRVATLEAGCLPYLISKKALAAFTRIAALELAPQLAVNGVAPGAVLPPPGKGEEAIRDLAGAAPLAHRCTPADIARAVLFLLQSDGITGQIINVDSGQHLLG